MAKIKVNMEQILDSKKYLESRIEMRTTRINKMKEDSFPKIIIDNEERQLKEYKHNLMLHNCILDAYRLGFKDGKKGNYETMKMFERAELTPEEVLERALFGSDDEGETK